MKRQLPPVKIRMSTAKPPFEMKMSKSKTNDHSTESRQRDAVPCYLSNGIRCSHGCDLLKESERCLCPAPLTVMNDGSCYEMRPSCLSNRVNLLFYVSPIVSLAEP